MENQRPSPSEPKKGMNKTALIVGAIILICCCLAALAAITGGIFFFSTGTTSTVPLSSTSNATPKIAALASAEEMNAASEAVGIVAWELVNETPGENRVCHTFRGQSWSVTPNEATNCIYVTTPGTTLEEATKSFLESGQLFADEKSIESNLYIEHDHILYVGTHPNAHTEIDLFVLKDGLLYWSSATVGSPAGTDPISNYQSYGDAIDTFLYEIIKINISRSQ